MSARRSNLAAAMDVIAWYWRGYFPLYDPLGRFCWVRSEQRAILPLTDEVVGRARRLMRRAAGRFTLEKNRRLDEMLGHLGNPAIKEHSWVRPEVVALYHQLRAANLLMTVEAIDARGELAGGLIGIILPGVYIAETMFYLAPDASKVCLCALTCELASLGFAFMDVQTPHDRDEFGEPIMQPPGRAPHPCIRLGERIMDDDDFLRLFGTTLAARWPAGPEEWVREAAANPAHPWLRVAGLASLRQSGC